MGIIRMIINFFKRLFGMSSTEQKALNAGMNAASTAQSMGAHDPAQQQPQQQQEEEEDYAKEEWREMQEFIARCEAERWGWFHSGFSPTVATRRRQRMAECASQPGRSIRPAKSRSPASSASKRSVLKKRTSAHSKRPVFGLTRSVRMASTTR